MNEHKDNIFIRFLKWVGLIKEYEVQKSEMCKAAQDICSRDCEDCAWREYKEEKCGVEE